MSDLTPGRPSGQETPGAARGSGRRTLFRVLGVVLMGTALVLFGLAIADFFAVSDMSGGPAPGEPGFAEWVDEEMNGGPSKGWMFFLGIPFFLLGGVFLQLGFAGATARYMAAEYSPAIQRVSQDLRLRADEASTGSAASGPYCRSCGRQNDADARFCDSCGTSMSV
jgi:hypothetical protein